MKFRRVKFRECGCRERTLIPGPAISKCRGYLEMSGIRGQVYFIGDVTLAMWNRRGRECQVRT